MDDDLIYAISTGHQAHNGNAFDWNLLIREDTNPQRLNMHARYGICFFQKETKFTSFLKFAGFAGKSKTMQVLNAVNYCFERRGWTEVATYYKEFERQRKGFFKDNEYLHTAVTIDRGSWIELQHYRERLQP